MANSSGLFEAIDSGDKDRLIELLKSPGIDVNVKDEEGRTALLRGAARVAIASILIERGADIEAKDKDGYTALLKASSSKHGKASIILLLDKGANLHATNIHGNTALMRACFYGHTANALLLIERGASINDKNKYGNSALLQACEKGHFETVLLLIERGANVHDKNNRLESAIMCACVSGNIEIVKLLCDRGVDAFSKNKSGKTAADIAEEGKFKAIVALLRSIPEPVNVHSSSSSKVPMPQATPVQAEKAKQIASPSIIVTDIKSTAKRMAASPVVSALLQSDVSLKFMKDILEVAESLPVFGQLVHPLTVIFDKLWKICESVKVFKDIFESFSKRMKEIAELLFAPEDGLIVIASKKGAGPSLQKSVHDMVNTLNSLEEDVVPYTNTTSFFVWITGANKLVEAIKSADDELTESIESLKLSLSVATVNLAISTYSTVTDNTALLNKILALLEQNGGMLGMKNNPDIMNQVAKDIKASPDDIQAAIEHQVEHDQKETKRAVEVKMKNDLELPELNNALRNPDIVPGLKDSIVDRVDVDYRRVLGVGGYATVYAGTYLGQDVAVKIFSSEFVMSESNVQLITREIAIQEKLSVLPGIVRILGASIEKRMIVMERAVGCLGKSLYNRSVRYSMMTKLSLILQIALTIRSIHFLGIIHRDIKPLNVLLFRDDSDDRIIAKLADFGFAKELSMQTSSSNMKGTVPYLAPECFRAKAVYNAGTDIYALGIMMCEIMSEMKPYEGLNIENEYSFTEQVKEGLRPTVDNIPKNIITSQLIQLIRECWDANPSTRPTIDDICARVKDTIDKQVSYNMFGGSIFALPPTPSSSVMDKKDETVPLVDLTVDQVCAMIERLDIDVSQCAEIIRTKKLTGKKLNLATHDDIQKYLNLESLDSRVLIEELEVFKLKGVPKKFLG